MVIKQPIKVRQVFQSYPLFYQPYIPPVIEALVHHPELDMEVQVFKEGYGAYVRKLPSYHFRRVYEKAYQIFKHYGYPLNYLEIKALKQQVDVIHIQDSYLFKKVYGLFHLPAQSRPKVVITLRGNDTYVKPWIQNKWRDFYKNYGTKVDAFVVMSEHQKNYLHLHWGISSELIHVIPISFGSRQYVSPKTIDGKQTIHIVSAFRMCWEKNIDGNLRVISYLKSYGIPVHYTMYGDGPDSGQVHYLIDKYGLQNEVSYKGRILNEDLKSSLSDYDFFLQLSHSDAFPTSVLEAQSFGLPAIVAESGGMSETISPNKSGFVVPSYDAEQAAKCIHILWNDTQTYTKFSACAIEHSQHNFSVDNEVNSLTNLYNTLIY